MSTLHRARAVVGTVAESELESDDGNSLHTAAFWCGRQIMRGEKSCGYV